MSPMKLRDSIRVPVRYGESEFDTLDLGSLRPGDGEANDEDWTEHGGSARSRSRKRHKPNIVPYNPNLPPAAFPTIDRPHPRPAPNAPEPQSGVQGSSHTERARDSRTEPRSVTLPIRCADARDVSSMGPGEWERISKDRLENHLASNNMDNPTYARNVENARNASPNSDGLTTRLDSDDDEIPDATQVLLEKIPDPKWDDLHPAMQVEIYENMMDDYNHYALHHVLGIGKTEYDKLIEFRFVRNKQIIRENEHLEQMRAKQRSALMAIDNSDLKMFEPPPQLVLKRIARDTTKMLISKYTDLMMCQSHDLLKARQYLHKRGLPRSYAGDWGDNLVLLKESEPDGPDPDQFEWNEELKFTPPPPPRDPALAKAHQDNLDFVNSFGRRFIAPANLVEKDTDREPIVDWGRYFERRSDHSLNIEKPRSKIVKLKFGRRNAAAMQQYERTGIMPRRGVNQGPLQQDLKAQAALPRGHTARFVVPGVVMPPVAMTQGSMMRFAMPHSMVADDTLPQFTAPSGPAPSGNAVQGTGRQVRFSYELDPSGSLPPPGRMTMPADARLRAIQIDGSRSNRASGAVIHPGVSSLLGQRPARPISRRLTSDYNTTSHAHSNARFRRHIARAHQAHLEELASLHSGQQGNRLPTSQRSGVGAGSMWSPDPAQQPNEEGSEPRFQGTSSWDEHEKAMSRPREELMGDSIHPDFPSNNAKNAE